MSDSKASNFIRNIILEDIASGKHEIAITRFPPEPNGLLHIGHAKAITINFDLAQEFGGYTYLRFDDTNPEKEDERFVRLIQEDIKWLGFEPHEVRYASDYFGEMYERAHILIDKGLAYIDDTPPEEMAEQRGDFTTPGTDSKHRNRPIEENRELFKRMKAGEFEEGQYVLRAKIDMQHPNMNMRDPVIYRIVDEPHYRTGDEWHIYPMYDFAHPLEDYVERITHSLCSLEFENNRPLYDWYIEHTDVEHIPRQYEFAKLMLTNTIIGKRFILKLVEEGVVDGWDDPRLLTISGMRRRGFTPDGIKNFIRATGVSKENSEVDIRQLEFFIREDLKLKAPRINAVLDPLKVTIINHSGETEMLEFELNPENPELGKVEVPFSNEVYIEREDFAEVPPKGYRRLYPGVEVRLRGAYFIKVEEIIKNEQGEIVELKCSYDPETKSGSGFTARKPKGTIHWVDAKEHVKARVKRYDLLVPDDYDHREDSFEDLNIDSIHRFDAVLDITARDAKAYDRFQFIRHGYFSVDPKYPDELSFNETVSLKSSYSR